MKGYHDSRKGIAIEFDDIYLAGGARTPFGKYCGSLSGISPTELGIVASRAAIEKSGFSASELDQAVIANIGQSSTDAYFLPRHIALYAGLPISVPALMVQRICASGMETLITASEQIALQKADAVLCCGTENMSLSPTASFGNRMGYQLGQPVFKDMLWESLDDTAAGCMMGFTAENLAEEYKISREEVDEFAKLSQDRALDALAKGFFEGEIIPVNATELTVEGLQTRRLRLPKGMVSVVRDENPRTTTSEALAKLPPVFKKTGVLTAGNCSGIVDGAAAIVVASGNKMKDKNLKPLARFVAAATCGVEPKVMGIGPVPAIRLLLEHTGLKLEDIGLFEINEAFGAQILACEKALGLDREKLNVNGGAIAIGHPLAATGLRITLTLARAMKARKVKFGIASACIGGGQGTAVLLENIEELRN